MAAWLATRTRVSQPANLGLEPGRPASRTRIGQGAEADQAQQLDALAQGGMTRFRLAIGIELAPMISTLVATAGLTSFPSPHQGH